LKDVFVVRQVEFQDFIHETLQNRKVPHRWIKIGIISEEAKNRIECECGIRISEIHIDNSSVIHALAQPHHNLDPDDLLHAVDVINSADDICLSEKKHKSCDVIIFRKNINGEITFLTEVHGKNDFLMIFNAWRLKKARRDPDAT